MIALYVLLGLALLFLLIGQIRVGGAAEYAEDGLTVKVKAAAFWFTVYPKPEKEKRPAGKKKKEKAPAQQAAQPAGKKKGGTLGLILELIPVVTEAVGVLLRRIRMDLLVLRLTWAAEDPAAAAVGYGAANAAIGAIYHPLDRAFRIKKSDIDISVDFDRTKPEVYGKAILTITVGQIVTLALHYGYRALRIWMKRRKKEPGQKMKKEATAHE